MKTALIQMDSKFGEIERNIATAERMIDDAAAQGRGGHSAPGVLEHRVLSRDARLRLLRARRPGYRAGDHRDEGKVGAAPAAHHCDDLRA